MKRIRERYHVLETVSPVPSGVRYRHYADGQLTDDYMVNFYDTKPPLVKTLDYEYMEDEVGPKADKSTPRAVLHTRLKRTRSVSGFRQTEGSPLGYLQTHRLDGPGIPWFSWGTGVDINHTDMLVSWPTTDEHLYREAEARFLDSNIVDTVLNSLESPQLHSSASSLLRSSRELRQIPRDRTRLTRYKAGRGLLSLGDLVSSGYLTYQFGVAPLMSDISKMYNQIGSVRDLVAKYNRLTEKPVRASAVGEGTLGFIDLNYPQVPMPVLQHTNWLTTLRVKSAPVRRCVISGRYPRLFGSTFSNALNYYFERYGGPGPAHLVWERIPFSFMVDWFLDTSSVLNHLENALRLDPKVVSSVTFSTSWEAETIGSYRSSGAFADTQAGHEVLRHSLRYYHRVPGTYHISNRYLSKDGFGKKQIALSAALLWSIGRSLAKLIS